MRLILVATAATAAIEYLRNPNWRATGRTEYRWASSGNSFLGSVGFAAKMSQDWTFLGRSLVNTFGDNTLRTYSQVGFAWRETNQNRWNALFRVENRYEKLDGSTNGELPGPPRASAAIMGALGSGSRRRLMPPPRPSPAAAGEGAHRDPTVMGASWAGAAPA